MYSEIEILGRGGFEGCITYGVMKTPCFPCEWYGGPFNGNSFIGYRPGDNATYNFHRTYDEALAHAIKRLEQNPIQRKD